MNWKIVTWYVGISMLMVAALMTVSGIIACCTAGDDSRMPLLFSAVITGTVGIFPLIFVRKGHHTLTFREGNSIVVIAWLLACFFGMLPFLFHGYEFSFVNALFESVSGFTTTGASILNDIEALPRGLQFWRIATAWVGGIGIVTLFSMMMSGSPDKSTLSGAEISSVARDVFIGQRSDSFAKRMIVTYVAITFTTFLALRITGLNWFDAATNAMSACSTCGFCPRNTSIAFYANPATEWVLTFAMLASGINLGILFLAFIKGQPRYIWKTETVKVFLCVIAAATVVVTADLMLHGQIPSFGAALRNASFQVVSISTTTGFATQDTNLWPPLSMAILVLCSFVCGCSGSTSGGIKIDRAILAAKGIHNKVTIALSPNLIRPIRVDGRIRPENHVNDAFCFVVCYMLVVILFGAVNLAGGMDFTSGITASIACIGNVGPGFGDVGSMGNYAGLSDFLKVSSLIEMLVGRLEIFPILYLLRSLHAR